VLRPAIYGAANHGPRVSLPESKIRRATIRAEPAPSFFPNIGGVSFRSG